MDFHTLSRRELQVLCKRNSIRANVSSAAMAEALESLDLVIGINYEMAPIPVLVAAPTVTTRLAARRSTSRKTEMVMPNPVPTILQRRDQEPKKENGDGIITEVKHIAASQMPPQDETCEDDDFDEDEEWALSDDDDSDVSGETHEEIKIDTVPDKAAVNKLLEDMKHINLNLLRAMCTTKSKTKNHLLIGRNVRLVLRSWAWPVCRNSRDLLGL